MTIQLTKIFRLRDVVREWHGDGKTVALVPTMGALHAGHLHLIGQARKYADRVIVSIFVNPKQFGPNEDFERYPRPLEADLEALNRIGVDAAWLPTIEEMYPNGFATNLHVAGLSEGLDGAARPGHFDGVATVVAKLLLQVMPDVALFGEKDYQQLCVIRRLVQDLNLDITVIGVPTVRDIDGLALSSRNQYLSEEARKLAPMLYDLLRTIAAKLRAIPGVELHSLLADSKKELQRAGFSKVDYIELRTEKNLAPLEAYSEPARLLAAAWLGTTRLIDNVSVNPGADE